jgi:hypothetical protein
METRKRTPKSQSDRKVPVDRHERRVHVEKFETETGIFRNILTRSRFTIRKDKPPTKLQLRALAGLLKGDYENPMAEVALRLSRLDDWAHQLVLEELRKGDPGGDYVFLENPTRAPDGSVVFRVVWKVTHESSRLRFDPVSVPPTNQKAGDADSLRRRIIEQWERIPHLKTLLTGQHRPWDSERILGAALLTMYDIGWTALRLGVRDHEPDAHRGKQVVAGAKAAHRKK